MPKTTYWASIEYFYNPKHVEYGSLKGGLVYAFYFTDDVRNFIKAVETDMSRLKMDIIRFEFVSVYDFDMQWDSADSTEMYLRLAKRAKRTKALVFDEFYAYKKL